MPTLPQTEGRWMPITRGRTHPVITGWVECFPATLPDGTDTWITIPGVSRYVGV